MIDLARQAEDAGIERVVISDHVVVGRNTHEYAWGKFPVPPEAPWLEPLTVLTAMAAVTTTIRLSTGILIAPLRPAALLAKTVATLDVLSGGRVDLGVGTGWQREEYEAEGLDFGRRGQLLTDTVAACRALWADTPATFQSPSISFSEIFCEPKPVQSPLPVWFSGVLHQRNLDRVVQLGDGWIPIMGAAVDDIRAGAEELRAAFVRRGRPTDSLRVQAPVVMVRNQDRTWDLAGSMASVPTLVGAGATDIHVTLKAFCPTFEGAGDVLQSLAKAFQAASP
jgi:probable F420-dependent oxidoreductase